MAPIKKSKSKSNSKPKLNVSKIVKHKHVRPAKLTLNLRRSFRLNPSVFGTHSPDLQAMIGREILSNFDPIQQLRLRAVSPMWDYNVRLDCRQVRAMVVNLNSDSDFRVKNDTMLRLYMREDALTPSTIEQLAKLYCNVEQLFIQWDSMQDANKLFEFLRHFPKVTAFGLSIWTQITDKNFVNQLFAIFNDHLELTSLTLSCICQGNETFSRLNVEEFSKSLSILRNFNLNCKFENMAELFEFVGKGLLADQRIKSLQVPATFELTQIAPMFERNPKLSQTKTFKLWVQSFDVLECLLSHFTDLEELILWHLPELEEERFSIEYIKTIAKLVHLQDLTIENFQPVTINQLYDFFPRIRRLHVINKAFFENIELEWISKWFVYAQTWQEMYKPFVENLAKQFPNIKELKIETNLSKIDEFKDEFINLCLKEFSKLKLVNLQQIVQE